MSLGQAIDAIIEALEPLDPTTRQTAINAACAQLNIQVSERETSKAPLPGDLHGSQTDSTNATSSKQIDIRSLKEEKSPKTAAQMACIVAYYLQELAPANERKQTINADDLDKYFKQAKYPLPKAISQLLPDARVAGYFESAPGKGEYSLNAVGYNLVAHNLPSKSNK